MAYDSLQSIGAASFAAIKPHEFMTVTQAGQQYHMVKRANSYNGPWSLELTPYLAEPQDVLTSLEYQGMIFVGPARTGKSLMAMNWLAYTAIVDPAEMMYVNSAQHRARDWSKADLSKFLRDSPEVRARMVPGRKNDNTYDKEFLGGMRLTAVWPTIDHFSGKTIPRHWIFDYDRIEDSINKEGNAYDLVSKRGESFKRFAMTVAESSPGRLIENPKWIPKTLHEAPPVKGILGLYNRGDRRRYYWRCFQCEDSFEPTFALFDYPGKGLKSFQRPQDPLEAAEQVTLVCPHCGYPHLPKMKQELNSGGRWVRDGMLWLPAKNEMILRPGASVRRSKIASFWMKGPAAAYQTWVSLVENFLNAEDEFEKTGDEEALKKTVNTDQGDAYTPKAMLSDLSAKALMDKAEDWGSTAEEPTVPEGVRFLVATVDVQARSNAAFVVQVHGFTAEGDIFIIDNFKIRKSDRFDEDGDRLIIDPAAFLEDWNVLIPQVIEKTYPLADGSGRRMRIKQIGCDSGGAEGVTLNAYNFWRALREDDEKRRYHRIFALVKGGTIENNPSTRVLMPDANRSDRNSGARGDVPVIEVNPWLVKDRAFNMLTRRIKVGAEDNGSGGSIRFANWLPETVYNELTNENRTAKGWENTRSRRNEAWDLLYYSIGLAIRPFDDAKNSPLQTIRFDHIFKMEVCPSWAQPWDMNSLIINPDEEVAERRERKKISFKDLGEKLS